MDTMQIGDFPHYSPGIWIQNFDLRGVRNVDAASGVVHSQIIPVALAPDRDFLQKVMAGGRQSC